MGIVLIVEGELQLQSLVQMLSPKETSNGLEMPPSTMTTLLELVYNTSMALTKAVGLRDSIVMQD